jgi:hypothetical protein
VLYKIARSKRYTFYWTTNIPPSMRVSYTSTLWDYRALHLQLKFFGMLKFVHGPKKFIAQDLERNPPKTCS